ncbi:MAG: hypothetical protein C4527_17665 [Candidatus Omnitrophota bacterium]|jgi:TolA-binding protein|nr:MAG: hypothetical protein C4527_17665 [Candidatus Omnitrophota bacterium]
MKYNTTIAVALCGLLLLPVAVYPQAAQTIGKNVEALLQQILDNQKQMQTDINQLKEQMTAREKEITQLREQLKLQKSMVEEKVQAIAEKTDKVAATGGTDFYSARVQYEVARQLQHDVIFNVRKGEQKAWFERVLVEFQKVVDNYPDAPEAPEAQLRIARIYHRYLDDLTQAAKEYHKLIDAYPNSPPAKEAQKALDRI